MANDRRKFLGKLALGAGSLAALPLIGANSRKDEEEMEEHAVREVRALGFQWETKDPFLFCVHHEDKYPEGNEDMAPDPALLEGRQIGQDFLLKDGWRMYHGNTVPGFPGHPHRGFETITVVREGMVDHADSLGAAGRYGNGDVQWMTAGKGILHSEMPTSFDKESHATQLWLNLEKKMKYCEPQY